MVSSADLLTSFEQCHRRGFWTRQFEKHRMIASEMVRRAVSAALLETEREDYGEFAGEEVVTLASQRGLDADHVNLYRSVMNHAAIADVIASAIRKPDQPPWRKLLPSSTWNPSALLDHAGNYIRRFLPVGTWNEERAEHEKRSWYGIGEVCMFEMPMQMVIAQMGPMNGGRRHGHWSKALLHPQRSSLRFKKRSRGSVEGFKESWVPVFREEHDEIERQTWLQAMFEDDVLQESLFVVEIPVPGEVEMGRIRDMAKRKLDLLRRMTELPDKQLSTCDGPLAPCPFRSCCWAEPELPPNPGIFDPVS